MSRQYIAAFVVVVTAMAGIEASAQHPKSVTIVSTEAPDGWQAPRLADGRPDLQGIWANDTATPLQRPEALGDKATLTDEELTANPRALSSRNIAKKLGQRLRPCW